MLFDSTSLPLNLKLYQKHDSQCTVVPAEDSGSDEDFCVDDDDDDSDYGKPKRKAAKGGRRGKPEKTPRGRRKSTGKRLIHLSFMYYS